MIQPIVEGYGDIQAVPLLLKRLAQMMSVFHVEIGHPIRKPASQLARREGLAAAIEIARRQPDCRAMLIVFDADDLCAGSDGPVLAAEAAKLARPYPCRLVLANREYEAWFLADTRRLSDRVGQDFDRNPDAIRGAKEELERILGPGFHYNEKLHQPRFSARIDLDHVYERSRSFQKLTRDFRGLLLEAGLQPAEWPA